MEMSSIASEAHVAGDTRLINQTNPHLEITQRAEALKVEANKIKKLSKQQFSRLEERYMEEVKEPGKEEKLSVKKRLKWEFAQKVEEEPELTSDIDKYLCYSNENQRFFDVPF